MSRRSRKRSRRKNASRGYDGCDLPHHVSALTPWAGAALSASASPVAVPVCISDHGSHQVRNLPALVPVYGADSPPLQVCDEDGHPVYVTESEARQLMRKGRATFHRVTKSIRGIRVVPEILRSPQRAGSISSRSITDPSDSASIDNCRGFWGWGAPIFQRIDGKPVRVPATSRTFRSLPKWAEEALLEQRQQFFRPLKKAA